MSVLPQEPDLIPFPVPASATPPQSLLAVSEGDRQ